MRSPQLEIHAADASWPPSGVATWLADEADGRDLSPVTPDGCDRAGMVSALLQMALSVSDEGAPWADDVSILLLSGWGALQSASAEAAWPRRPVSRAG